MTEKKRYVIYYDFKGMKVRLGEWSAKTPEDAIRIAYWLKKGTYDEKDKYTAEVKNAQSRPKN